MIQRKYFDTGLWKVGVCGDLTQACIYNIYINILLDKNNT